jgi:hypothetical protein
VYRPAFSSSIRSHEDSEEHDSDGEVEDEVVHHDLLKLKKPQITPRLTWFSCGIEN